MPKDFADSMSLLAVLLIAAFCFVALFRTASCVENLETQKRAVQRRSE